MGTNRRTSISKAIQRDTDAARAARDRIREKLFCVCGRNMQSHRLDYSGGRWLLCLPEKGCTAFILPADAAAEEAEAQKRGAA
jgi:hypothetical protein